MKVSFEDLQAMRSYNDKSTIFEFDDKKFADFVALGDNISGTDSKLGTFTFDSNDWDLYYLTEDAGGAYSSISNAYLVYKGSETDPSKVKLPDGANAECVLVLGKDDIIFDFSEFKEENRYSDAFDSKIGKFFAYNKNDFEISSDIRNSVIGGEVAEIAFPVIAYIGDEKDLSKVKVPDGVPMDQIVGFEDYVKSLNKHDSLVDKYKNTIELSNGLESAIQAGFERDGMYDGLS